MATFSQWSRWGHGKYTASTGLLFKSYFLFFLNGTFAFFRSSPAQPGFVIDNCVKCIFAIGNRGERS